MKLEQFLVKAKINAYASEGEGGEETLADGSKELTFQEGGFRYRDRYFGFDPFIGEEIVWHGDRVIWAMNYYGTVFDEVVPADQVYRFLGKAMRRVNRMGNRLMTFAFNLIYMRWVRDILSGMWVIRTDILPRLHIISDNWNFSEEIKIEAMLDPSVRFAEHPIEYSERIGETKLLPFRVGVDNLVFLLKKRGLTLFRRTQS